MTSSVQPTQQHNQHSIRIRILLMVLLLGVGMLLLAQLRIFYNPPNDPVEGDFALMLTGFALVMLAAPPQEVEAQALDQDSSSLGAIRLRVRPLWLVLALVLAGFTAWRATLNPEVDYFGEHMLVWGLSMIAMIVAFWPAKRQQSMAQTGTNSNHDRATDSWHRWEYLLLVILFLGAFAIRVADLENLPDLLDQDEAQFAINGVAFNHMDFRMSPYEPSVHSHPALYQALMGLSIRALGQTKAAARLPSVIFGALGIPALYLLGRELGGKRLGLIAALFMLAWPLHIMFSRLAMNQPADPLFTTFSFYFLLRGLRRRNSLDYTLSGISMGLAQYFYLGGRLAPLVMLAYLIFLWWREGRVIRSQWRLIALVPLTALIVTIPQDYYLLHFGLPLTTRAGPSFVLENVLASADPTAVPTTWDDFKDQIGRSFLAIWTTPDSMGWYGESSNLMGPFGGSLLLVGVGVSLLALFLGKPRLLLPLGWALAVIITGSTLTANPPQYQRYFPGVAAFALLVAMGLDHIVVAFVALQQDQIEKSTDKQLRTSQFIFRLGAVLAIVLCLANAVFFYAVFVPQHSYLDNRPNKVTNKVAHMMQDFADKGIQIVLVASPLTSDDPSLTGILANSEGVSDSQVVQYFMADRPYKVIEDGVTLDKILDGLDTSKPFAIFMPMLYINEFKELWTTRLPGADVLSFKINEDDATPAFFVYLSRTGLAVKR